jgi:TRAP-type mannitol/chloroaromatic compound transport system permease large subunit
MGYLRAVEAAATAGLLLLFWGAASRSLTRELLWQVLDDAMAMTGALFALLIAASTFSLVLRGLGSDRLVTDLMGVFAGHPMSATLAALAVLLTSAFVLDAFELIFLIVPIVMPSLLTQVDDAAWVAVLALLVLQAGFLMPPFGYSVVLSRAHVRPRPEMGATARALAPFLVWLTLVAAMVFAVPQTTQWLRHVPPGLGARLGPRNDDVSSTASENIQRSFPLNSARWRTRC